MATHLDREAYESYLPSAGFDIDGATLRWSGIPERERERVLETIEAALPHLRSWFDVHFEVADVDATLRLSYRQPADRGIVLLTKGMASSLLAAASWGGP